MKFWIAFGLAALGVSSVVAMPQGQSPHPITSTPKDCSTATQTAYAIDTTVTDFEAFWTSLRSAYPSMYTELDVAIYTDVATDLSGYVFTEPYLYNSAALVSAGFGITSYYVTTTECAPVLPPSPTGSICSPHIDHWHCEPMASATSTGPPATTCSPHFDHWHCPPGVPEPTYLPGEEPHDGDEHDHGNEDDQGDEGSGTPAAAENTGGTLDNGLRAASLLAVTAIAFISF